jgi:hypothetical protein
MPRMMFIHDENGNGKALPEGGRARIELSAGFCVARGQEDPRRFPGRAWFWGAWGTCAQRKVQEEAS